MKKTAFWIFTVTSIFLASFKSAIAATSPMALAISTIIGLVTPIFDAFSKTNEQGVTLIKFVLWLLLFAVLFSVSGPLFKGKKSIAGIVAGVIALISVVMIPNQMVLSIAYEYSGIATFVFLVAPIFCMFWLNKKIPDTPIGDAMKFFIYLVMAILAWKLVGSAQQMTTPFLKDIVGSVWWTLFALIVSAAAARYLWKFGASTFAGPHMERGASWAGEKAGGARSWFSRKPKVNPDLKPPTTPPTTPPETPPGGAGPVIPTQPGTTTPPTTTTPPGGASITAAVAETEKFEKYIEDIENRRKSFSLTEIKQVGEQIKHIQNAQKLFIEAVNMSQMQASAQERPRLEEKAKGIKESVNTELQRIRALINEQVAEFRNETIELDKEVQAANSLMGWTIQALAMARLDIKKYERRDSEESVLWYEKCLRELEDLQKSIEPAAQQLAAKVNQEVDKQIKMILAQIMGFVNAETKLIDQMLAKGDQAHEVLSNDFNLLLQYMNNRKALIFQKESLTEDIKKTLTVFKSNLTELGKTGLDFIKGIN